MEDAYRSSVVLGYWKKILYLELGRQIAPLPSGLLKMLTVFNAGSINKRNTQRNYNHTVMADKEMRQDEKTSWIIKVLSKFCDDDDTEFPGQANG